MYNNSGNCKGMVYVVKEGDTLLSFEVIKLK